MKRNEFLNRLSLGTGAAVLLPSVSLLQGCEYKPITRTALTEADIPLLDEIGEAIIPTTNSSPGAKATNIGEYILLMYKDCMPVEEQAVLVAGINELDAYSAKAFEVSFLKADATERFNLMEDLQTEAIAYNLKMEDAEKPLPHYFDMLKGMTLSGYFSSEIGMTQAREYLPLPGKFEACISYNEGDKPWAT